MAEKKTHQIHEFEVGIYPRVLWVAVGVPIAEQRALFGDELPDMDDSADAEVAVVRAEKPKPRVESSSVLRVVKL